MQAETNESRHLTSRGASWNHPRFVPIPPAHSSAKLFCTSLTTARGPQRGLETTSGSTRRFVSLASLFTVADQERDRLGTVQPKWIKIPHLLDYIVLLITPICY